MYHLDMAIYIRWICIEWNYACIFRQQDCTNPGLPSVQCFTTRMKGFQENLKNFFWFKNGWKQLKLKFFGFNVFFYIWQPWDFCLFSSDFHKMSIANHLLTKWKWMLWLVTDLWKTSWNPFIWVLKHHAVGRPGSRRSKIPK